MFIRYNEAAKYYEYDTSAGQTGAGPWVILPISPAQILNLPGNLGNAAYTNVVNQFKLNQRISNELGDYPRLTLKNVNLGVDQKIWQIIILDGNLSFWALNDAESAVMAQFAIDRNGTLVTGSIPDSRLTGNVALLNRAQTFTAKPDFNTSIQINAGVIWYNSSAAGDQKLWHDVNRASGERALYPVNDAQNTILNNGFNFYRNGFLGVAGGVVFPPAQISTSDPNALDDYEEGTWSPYLSNSDGGVSTSYTYRIGRYTKIGNTVTCYFKIGAQTYTWTSGYMYLSGFPFTPQGDGMPFGFSTIFFEALAGAVYTITLNLYENQGTAHFNFKNSLSGNNDGALMGNNVVAGTVFTGTIVYKTAT